MNTTQRITANFKKTDSLGRIILSNPHTMRSLQKAGMVLGDNIREGDPITLCDDKIAGVIGIVTLTPDGEWVAVVDWEEVGKCLQ
jgi:hypothetical protein